MPTSLEWILAIISNTIHTTLIFIILYYASRFYRFRWLQALQKRYPFSVYLMTTCIVFYLIQHLTYKITYIHGVNTDGRYNLNILSLISNIFYCFSMHGMLSVLSARSWSIYFNIKWGLQIQKSEWSVHLNPALSPSTFWFIAHRKDYGSQRYISTFVLIYYLSEAVFLFCMTLFVPNYSAFIDLALYLVEFTVLIIIWNKIPQFHDVFYLKKELQYILRAGSVGLILYIAYILKTSFFGYNLIGFMILQCIFGVVVAVMALILNGFVFTQKCYDLLLERNRGSPAATDSSITVKYTLKEVLSNNKLIECFFKHLLDEFSVELLLAFIEIQQFEDLIRNDDIFMNDIQEYVSRNTTATLKTNITLPDTLPQSHIVYVSHADVERSQMRYLRIADDLMRKYIKDGSEFEINISYGCKRELISFVNMFDTETNISLNNDEKYKLFTLFLSSKQTLLRLMHSSHQRCLGTNRYPAPTN